MHSSVARQALGGRRAWAFGLWLLATGCGYAATPVLFELSVTTADRFEVRSLATRGTLDPSASSFTDGVLLSTRWQAEREGTEVVELWLDLRRSALPEVLAPSEPPLALSAADEVVVATLIQRGPDGKVVLRQTPSFAQVVMSSWRPEGNRELAAGSFVLELERDAGALYAELGGLFETVPRPYGPSVLGGDWQVSDPASSDPGSDPTSDPGADPGSDPRPTDEPPSDDEVVFDEGCSCPGGGGDETLPTEEEPVADDDGGGGCDCQGDDSSPPGDPDDGDSATGGGCDCQGDDSGPPGDPDDGDSATGGGCDCQGDEDPEPTDARLEPAARASQLAATTPRRFRRAKCQRATGRLWWALSPFVAFCWLGARQRRRD